MAIHYAKINESERLQRVFKLLSDEQWHGTRDIVRAADVCAVNTVIAELRANSLTIVTRCVGRGRYEYKFVPMQIEKNYDPPRFCDICGQRMTVCGGCAL